MVTQPIFIGSAPYKTYNTYVSNCSIFKAYYMKNSWYKEPWAWFVFFLPFSAVVAGTYTYVIANTDPDPLVVGNYYKKGKAINFELSKIKLAQKLGMKFSMAISENELVITPTGIEKEFPLIKVSFYHPTQEEKDLTFTLTPDGQGLYRHHLDNELKGKWQVTFTPFDDQWKIQNTIHLPQSLPIDIFARPNNS